MHMMRIPFLHRSPDPFPRPKDLPGVPADEAARALEALRRMISIDIAKVYTAHGSKGRYWQVWLDITWRRLTLAEWAAEWLQTHPATRSTLPPATQQEGA